MLRFGNKEFRNLQEQVFKNMNDISFILQEEGVLNEFGIKVVGQEASVIDMPTVDDYKEDNPEWAYGDAYAIGTEAPYELYILTRANGTHPDDYWFNIGEFPLAGPEGPEGPQGETGPQGQTGPSGQDGVSPEISIGSVSATTLSASASATASVSMTGTYAQPVLNFAFGIPQGQDGSSLTSVAWGDITGSLANQTDLVSALQAKQNASAMASYATQVYADNKASNATYEANVYTNSAISALSSVYMTETAVGDYLTDNQYAHIQDIPTDTSDLTNNAGFITNSALSGYATESWVSSNFLSIGTPIGGTAEWGSIIGTLSNQTDLMSKFSEYALSSVVDNLNYASVGALSSETVIPDITGLASEGYVNTQISNLSSVYASISALSEYATESYVTSAISALDYASVNALSANTVIPTIPSGRSGVTLAGGYYGLSDVIPISLSFLSNTSTSFYGHVRFKSNATFEKSVCFGGSAIYNGSTIAGGFKLDLPNQSGSLALITDIPSLSGYATESWVSSNFLSSDTVIPEISGTNDGSYWTSITINEDTYDIPQGGASGDYVPVIVEDSDEYHRYSGEVSNSDSAITLQVVKENDEGNTYTSLDLYQDDAYLSHSWQETVIKPNPDYDPEDPESGSETIEEVVDLSTNLYVGEGTITANRTSYDGDTEETVSEEVDLFDLASMSYVDDSISALSSIYQPIGSYVSQADLSGYARKSEGSNYFTNSNTFASTVLFSGTGITTFNNGANFLASIYFGSNNSTDPVIYGSSRDLNIRAKTSGKIKFSDYYSSFTLSEIALKTEIPSTSEFATQSWVLSQSYLSSIPSGYATESWVSSNFLSIGYVPTVSGYAELSADNTFTGTNNFTSVYANKVYFNSSTSTYVGTDNLSVLYALNNLGSISVQALSGLQLYGSTGVTIRTSTASVNTFETWTFTLSDNTTVSKTILVG